MPALLTNAVEAFESALDADSGADLADFLPAATDPDYPEVLVELVRVDMERTWADGEGRLLSDYRARFPGVFTGGRLQAVAFEEFRQRRIAGQVVLPAEYVARYAVDVTGWDDLSVDSSVYIPATCVVTPPPAGGCEADPPTDTAPPDPVDAVSAARWAKDGGKLPEEGQEFHGLHLLHELGRGAFGRVFLARQNDLAGRPVAVKVAVNIAGESQTLAQLQHTNIVPIYSFHRYDKLQVVVMPYFGRTTLARVIRRLGGGATLPASGRELLSTLDMRAEQTVGSAAQPPAGASVADNLPADGWLKLDGLSYPAAVLSLGAELADGLAHAHARGILHRDLKPANVLLTDEGRPMLLDFNLAEDTKLRGSVAGAGMGGTLPYMSPEQLRAFAKPGLAIDGRSDVYSLGVVLFELLTGRHPFPTATKPDVAKLLADRAGPAPRLRTLNPEVSPAAESIIRKCLAADPDARYPSAAALADDLRRQVADQPLKHAPEPSPRERLRKWARRHPTLTSTTGVALAAGLLLAVTVVGAYGFWDRTRNAAARDQFAQHASALQTLRLKAATPEPGRAHTEAVAADLRALLARYGVPADGSTAWLDEWAVRRLPAVERDKLRADVGELFLHLTRAEARLAGGDPAKLDAAERLLAVAARHADRLPRALAQARADLAAARKVDGGLQAQAEATPAGSPRDQYLTAARLIDRGQARLAVEPLRAAVQGDSTDAAAWFLCGHAHLDAGQYDLAAGAFGSCTALLPEYAAARLNRGSAYTRLRMYDLALSDFNAAILLDPSRGRFYLERAVAYQGLGQLAKALADLDRACADPTAGPLAFTRRAALRRKLGDHTAAEEDVAAAFTRPCTDPMDWVARSKERLARATAVAAVGGPLTAGPAAAEALADVRQGLAADPDHHVALQQLAAVLSNWLGRDAEAVAAMDRLVIGRPQWAQALVGRAVLRARTGDKAGAVRDAVAASAADPAASDIAYRLAGAYAQIGDKKAALAQLGAALRNGYGRDLIARDPDLDPLRADPDFRRLVAAVRGD